MNPPRLEVANGVCDGVNRSFFTSLSYLDSSVQMFINGMLQRPDSFALSPPRFMTLDEAPRPGELIQVYYRPR